MTSDSNAIGSQPATGEAPLDIQALLYSRCHSSGTLQSFNDAFRKVPNYSAEALTGAPHRILRHPDMPAAVFKLLWDRIEAGLTTGIYLKCQSSDGLFFWVFALVTPVEDGYLSVWIKPSSPIFEAAQTLYAGLKATETDAADPDLSVAALTAAVTKLGYFDYDEFMAVGLAAELTATARARHHRPEPLLAEVSAIVSALRDIRDEKVRLLRSFEEIRAIPMNLHIIASRIEAYGGPVATLAENYRLMAADFSRRLEIIIGQDVPGGGLAEAMLRDVSNALFRLGCAQLQDELANSGVELEGRVLSDEGEPEEAMLHALAVSYAGQADMALRDVSRTAAILTTTCEELKRAMLGLDSIRVLCRVEAGRLQARGAFLQSINNQLDLCHAEIGDQLEKILNLAMIIRNAANVATTRHGNGRSGRARAA